VKKIIILSAVLSGLLTASPTREQGRSQVPPKDDPLYMRLAARPSPQEAALLVGNGLRYSGYEVYLTNFGSNPIRIVAVSVSGDRDPGKAIVEQKYADMNLNAIFQFSSPGTETKQQPVLESNESAVLFLFPQISGSQNLPDRFETVITIRGEGNRGGSGTIRISPITLNDRVPVIIHPPIEGENWIAANGPSNSSAHRRAILLFNGMPKIGQRYAVDWVQLGPDGKTFHGDERKNTSYYAYDHLVRAVADGTVVEVKDGIAENVPNSGKIATQIAEATLAGNHVIEDLGSGRFAAYAHLRPGTIREKPGDRVHAGDIIGHLGNSGNSSEPHLHFQLCDGPSFIDCEGLPFAIDNYTRSKYSIEKTHAGQPTWPFMRRSTSRLKSRWKMSSIPLLKNDSAKVRPLGLYINGINPHAEISPPANALY